VKRYLLDTSPLAAFLLGRRTALETISPWIARRQVSTSIMVYGEVVEYIRQMVNYPALHTILIRQLEEIKPLSITRTIMERYAEVRMRMRPPYGPGVLTDSDTLIAATAIKYDLVLVTHDERDFSRVPGLKTLLVRSR
jgi:tRNA(fMet)-specific endonuclease VapC